MTLASLVFAFFMFAADQTQTIIESSVVIATSVAALVAALRANNKKKATRASKPKPRATVPARPRSDESLMSNSM